MVEEKPVEVATCPECGTRVEFTDGDHKLIDPACQCKRPEGWARCPNLRFALSKTRQTYR